MGQVGRRERPGSRCRDSKGKRWSERLQLRSRSGAGMGMDPKTVAKWRKQTTRIARLLQRPSLDSPDGG